MEKRKLLDILAQINPSGLRRLRKDSEQKDTNDLRSEVQGHLDNFDYHDRNIKEKLDKLKDDDQEN